MKDSNTSRQDATGGTTQGETVPVQGERQERVSRQPHERDESASSQASDAPSHARMGEMARRDLEAGRQDTSKRPELERTYDKLRDGGTAGPTESTPRR